MTVIFVQGRRKVSATTFLYLSPTMKHRFIFILFLLLSYAGKAQLYDKTWVVGYPAGKITFDSTHIDTAQYFPLIYCFADWACISNKDGEFQFFTEGVNVYRYDGSNLINGNNLADNTVNGVFNSGLPDQQNVFILPKSNTQYYIIYQSQTDPEYALKPWWYTNVLYYSVVDMSTNFGQGEVIQKRIPVNSTYFMDGHMTACQHANGRDWWLVQRGYNNNRYFIYLVTPDSISLKREQFIGPASHEPDAVGQSAFSPDGSKYASITGNSSLILMDFDRCSGEFGNPKGVSIPTDTFTFYGQTKIIGHGGNGLCFSPNNRFIYVNSLYILRQYDLWSSLIDSSEKVIFLWTDSNEYLGQFNQIHLGPDGKIYSANYQGFTEALHVIHCPDSPGIACLFEKWGLPIATTSAFAISNMIHFRMGPLIGSGCDTISGIGGIHEERRELIISPNPATNDVSVSIPTYLKDARITITDAQGKAILQEPFYLTHHYNCSAWASGTYFVTVSDGRKTYTRKVVKE